MHLTWTTPTDAGGLTIDDYVIEWSIDGTTWTTIDDGVSVATEFGLNGLTNGATYWFRASAVNAMGTGASSELVEATPAGPSAAPGGLTTAVAPATGVGSGQVKLTWTASVVSNVGVVHSRAGSLLRVVSDASRPVVKDEDGVRISSTSISSSRCTRCGSASVH